MRIGILLILIQLSSYIVAQDYVNIAVKQPSVAMGELFEVSYTIYADSAIHNRLYLENSDTIISKLEILQKPDDDKIAYNEFADFDIEDYGKWQIIDDKYIDSSSLQFIKQGDRFMATNTVKMTAWYPGKFRLPSLFAEGDSVYMLDQTKTEIIVQTPSLLASQDSFKLDDLEDISDIIREPVSWRDYLFIIIPVALLLLAAILGPLIYYLLQRIKKKNEEVEEEIVIIPAHVLALEKLYQLKENKPWQSGDIKEYQSELTYIIREYLEKRFEIDALESSTKEIKSDLAELKLSSELVADVANILQIADLVKFAKANPTGDIHEQFLDRAFSFVKETKEVIVENHSSPKNSST